jgi:hypothetical protein
MGGFFLDISDVGLLLQRYLEAKHFGWLRSSDGHFDCKIERERHERLNECGGLSQWRGEQFGTRVDDWGENRITFAGWNRLSAANCWPFFK